MANGTILFTLGDPFSINCEGFVRSVVPKAKRFAVVAIGSRWQFEHQLAALNFSSPVYTHIDALSEAVNPGVYFLDPEPHLGHKSPDLLANAERGALACAALNAIPKSFKSPVAVLTAPIDKYAASLAGFGFPGQTEFFERLWSKQAVMVLAGPKLRVALTTNHIALVNVAATLSQSLIVEKLLTLHEGLRHVFGIAAPRIAVCGLNPHCSDNGLFGTEDMSIVVPAVRSARTQIVDGTIDGPLPADTVFYRALAGRYDAVLAQYHDQGLAPLKTVHFDDAVNVSIGLPYLRVSPDHGPAADLYATGRANFTSFQAAADLCDNWLTQQDAVKPPK